MEFIWFIREKMHKFCTWPLTFWVTLTFDCLGHMINGFLVSSNICIEPSLIILSHMAPEILTFMNFTKYNLIWVVAMETGLYLKMLKGAKCAPIRFVTGMTCRFKIKKNILWDLFCKVNPYFYQTIEDSFTP